jgi:pSer/pThr/pTyr-binding forkhead associated (FHA) protein
MSKTHSECQERHVLVINDSQRRAIALEAAAYSLGRDLSNAIVIDVDTISRQHAILLRVPIPGKNQYRYRLIDGNFEGKPSANGVFINDKKSSTRDLDNGDVIRFGQNIEASYLIVSMGEVEFNQYLEGISYQSLKSEMVNPKETLVASFAMEEELREALAMESQTVVNSSSKATLPSAKATVPSAKATLSSAKLTLSSSLPETVDAEERLTEGASRLWKTVISGLFLVAGGIVGIWFLLSQSHPSQSSAETRNPTIENQQTAPQ